MKYRNWRSLTLAAAVALVATAASAHASEGAAFGMSHVTDGASYTHGGMVVSDGTMMSSCPENCPEYCEPGCPCPLGYCPHGLLGNCPNCLAILSPFGRTHNPAYGWAPPARHPIYRLPVHYQKFWPNFWYGQPGIYAPLFPMVYQPTDTTQLGFYYQRVPYWQPNPAMVPQTRPWPQQWHHAAAGAYGYGGAHHGGLINHAGHGEVCPTIQQGTVIDGATTTYDSTGSSSSWSDPQTNGGVYTPPSPGL